MALRGQVVTVSGGPWVRVGFMAGSWGSLLLIFDETPGLLHDSEEDEEGLFARTPGSFASGD